MRPPQRLFNLGASQSEDSWKVAHLWFPVATEEGHGDPSTLPPWICPSQSEIHGGGQFDKFLWSSSGEECHRDPSKWIHTLGARLQHAGSQNEDPLREAHFDGFLWSSLARKAMATCQTAHTPWIFTSGAHPLWQTGSKRGAITGVRVKQYATVSFLPLLLPPQLLRCSSSEWGLRCLSGSGRKLCWLGEKLPSGAASPSCTITSLAQWTVGQWGVG